MDANALIDLESGTREVIDEQLERSNAVPIREPVTGLLNQVLSGSIGIDGVVKGDESLRSGNGVSDSGERSPSKGEDLCSVDKGIDGKEDAGLIANKGSAEKAKKKSCKKPPRPPRPTKSASFDMADQKLMRELAELAELKRARIERMKKKIKIAKLSSSNSNNNLFALVITVLFCLVIVWQGFFSLDGNVIRFHGAPETSVQGSNGLITIQFYKNLSQLAPDLSQSASLDNVVPMPGVLG